jgi:plastocyanin
MSRWMSGPGTITALAIGLGLLGGLGFWLTGQGAMAIAPANQAALTSLADPTEVRIEGFAFTPTDVTIQVGATVHWENFDLFPHTVTSVTRQSCSTQALLIPVTVFSTNSRSRVSIPITATSTRS